MVRLHEFFVWVKEDSDLAIATDDPDGQRRCLEPRAEIVSGCLDVAVVPDEESYIATTVDAHSLVNLTKQEHLR